MPDFSNDRPQIQSLTPNSKSAIQHHFCTYFDRNYLYKGLALYRSLERHCSSFCLWILCLDEVTRNILIKMQLPKVVLVSLDEFEAANPRLLEVKSTRTPVEYYWTLTPSWCLYLLEHDQDVEIITYLDADLFFFSDVAPIFEELREKSIAIVEHRFAPAYVHNLETAGMYNVSLSAFRRDEEGLACLCRWRDQCIDWCFFRSEEGKLGDQMYLNDWPSRFRGVRVLQHAGAGVAPWNIGRYVLSRHNGLVFVDAEPLIFYHFHQFCPITTFIFELAGYGYHFMRHHVAWVYRPYMAAIRQSIREVYRKNPCFHQGYASRHWRDLVRSFRDGRLYFLFDPRLWLI